MRIYKIAKIVQLQDDIKNVVDLITKYLFSMAQSYPTKRKYAVDIFNPYLNKEETIYISMSDKQSVVKITKNNKKIIDIDISPIIEKNKNAEEIIREDIYHEITHIVDPKFSIPKFTPTDEQRKSPLKYLKLPIEVDAKDSGVIRVLKEKAQKNNIIKERLLQSMRSGFNDLIKEIRQIMGLESTMYLYDLDADRERQFMQRLYHELS